MSNWFANLQKALPQHGVSRLIGGVAASRTPWLKSLFIEQFARAYRVSLDEAEADSLSEFDSFNSFFTRALKSDSRPLSDGPGQLISPADGTVSQLGEIRRGQLLQAKGHRYTVNSLAGSLAAGFDKGSFCTIYLAPSDYHRVHLPYSGELTATLAIPGALFSVNQRTEDGIDGLFCRNERLVCRFETEFGPMLVVLVGAMIVASIETDWLGPLSPYAQEELTEYQLHYETGDEIGRFLLGSTVICCFPPDAVTLNPGWQCGTKVQMGQSLGTTPV
ncbi:MAG: archaetidylserine decarboxylase [Pseudomonadota bacterium]